MALSTTNRRKDYLGNGVSLAFTYDFRIFAEADLAVSVNGVLQTLTTDYTVSGVNDPAGGQVTFVVAPPAPADGITPNVLLLSAIPPTQGIDLLATGPFPAETVEQIGLDRLAALVQQLLETLRRTPSLAATSQTRDLVIPELAGQAGRVLGVDGAEAALTFLSQITGVANPMTAPGDLIVGGVAGAPARLAKGADDTVPSVIAGALGYRLIPTASLADGAVTTPKLDAAVQALLPSTGDLKPTLKAVADAGWVLMNDGSIGSAASGATTRAHADTEALFTLLWNNVTNAWAPVSGGRGASAAADFAANKTLTLVKALGRALAGAGAGAGLTARALGETLGEEAHVLAAAENGPHTHDLSNHTHTIAHTHALTHAHAGGGGNTAHIIDSLVGTSDTPTTDYSTGAASTGTSGGPSTNTSGSAGSGTPHNTMQPTLFINWMVKL